MRGARDIPKKGALREATQTKGDGRTQSNLPCETHQLSSASLHVPDERRDRKVALRWTGQRDLRRAGAGEQELDGGLARRVGALRVLA